MKIRFLMGLAGIAALACGGMSTASPATAAQAVKVRLAVDEDPIVPRLAQSLGYFEKEGIEIVPVKVEDFAHEDYLLQEPLIEGQIDAVYHWFNHTVFGARHNLPVKAVMVINDAPGMTVMVANRVKDQIRSAADFKGRTVAEGAGYGTKSLITGYLARKMGLPAHSYTPVMIEQEGRRQAVIDGLKEGKVDVMTFQEPLTSALLATKLVTPLYDLNSGQSTAKVLGAAWPAQSILMAPAYIDAHPEVVQRLVNAFVGTMRYINAHTADEIVAALPPSYFEGKNREAEVKYIRNTLSTFAKGDYSFSPQAVRLVVDAIQSYDFDQSEEGRWRSTAENPRIDPEQLYTNRFVTAAMKTIR